MTLGSIGGYRILRRLGVGGMGEVFLARQESAAGLGRAVVIKVVSERHAHDREAHARFLDEARLALQLRHRNICGVTHVGEADGRTFLVMEYVAGRDVRDVLRALEERGRRMSPALALLVLKEIVDALDYAHRMIDPRTGSPLGIVHRDVSPSNVMVSLEGEVQLIDFGTAVSSWKVERTAAGRVVGKVRYMSPEQARGDAVDARSDVYSACIVGAELLSGLTYREQMGDRELLDVTQRGDRSPVLGLIDADLRALLERGLAADRARRANAGEIVRAIEELLVARRDVVGPADLRAMMRELFPEELARQRERLAEVLADGGPANANTGDVVFFSRLEAAVNEPAPAREVTQIVRTRSVTRPNPVSGEATVVAHPPIGDPMRDGTTRETATRPPFARGTAIATIVVVAIVVVVAIAAAWLSRAPSDGRRPVVVAAVVVQDAGVEPSRPSAAPLALDAGQPPDEPDAANEPDEPAEIEAAEEPEPSGAPTVRRAIRKKEPPVSTLSLRQKLAALKTCGKGCARTLLAQGAANKTADETRAFLVEVDRCVVQCRR